MDRGLPRRQSRVYQDRYHKKLDCLSIQYTLTPLYHPPAKMWPQCLPKGGYLGLFMIRCGVIKQRFSDFVFVLFLGLSPNVHPRKRVSWRLTEASVCGQSNSIFSGNQNKHRKAYLGLQRLEPESKYAMVSPDSPPQTQISLPFPNRLARHVRFKTYAYNVCSITFPGRGREGEWRQSMSCLSMVGSKPKKRNDRALTSKKSHPQVLRSC